MKRMLKHYLMVVLITAICMVLFASISWAGSRVTYHNNMSYDTGSRHLGSALQVNSRYSGYYHNRRYGSHGHNKHGYYRNNHYRNSYRNNHHKNSYRNNHHYYRQRNGHKHYNIRPRHGRRYHYGYKQGYSGRHRGYKYGYHDRHYVYMDDDKQGPQGYKGDKGMGYENHLKHASEPMATRITRINRKKGHVYIDRGKNAGFKMGSKACIYLLTGESIACGRVRKISPSHAMIEINNRKAKQFKNGMEAMLIVEEKD
ncbi:MAG: hypothetical protein JSW04_01830 [Desulfobacterales bacterium]|nr:MAG: hypothetical protein JSW04_01830 [Desulfobacterales bacterium]